MRRVRRIAAAAVLAIGVGVAISYMTADRNGGVALAEAYEQLQQAKTVTWTEVFYQRLSTKDRKTTWAEACTSQHMYKAPGRTRKVERNHEGQIIGIEIVDQVRGKSLSLDPGKRKAWLTYRGEPSQRARSGIADVFTHLSQRITAEAKPLGKQEINGRSAAGFRVASICYGFGDERDEWSDDFWIDEQSKRLVRTHHPGLDKYDPDKDPTRNNPPGDKVWFRKFLGTVRLDIVYDQQLDDSLFDVEPPAGYAIETTHVPEPTEKDMIDWLRVWAECNDGTFPESELVILKKVIGKFNRKEKLSPAEEKLHMRALRAGGHHPIHRFAEMNAGDTWHYQGSGVVLGNQDAIVCWYRPKGAKTYRVVYGDLTVKVLAPEDLPTPRGN
ncbi:MAG: hypothetical protein ACYTG0_00365 [Planctomycetota bacterium]|jgi:hypothetical protein